MALVYIFLFLLTLIVSVQVASLAHFESLRRRGLYPPRDRATLEDVERLAGSGHRLHAIRAYRELRGVSLMAAKDAVASMQRNQAMLQKASIDS